MKYIIALGCFAASVLITALCIFAILKFNEYHCSEVADMVGGQYSYKYTLGCQIIIDGESMDITTAIYWHSIGKRP